MSRKGAAARIYKVGRSTVYRWLGREDLRPTVVKTRKRKMDWAALKEHVEQYPEAQLKDRAKQFGVQPVAQAGRSPCAVHYALRKMKITRKKELRYQERDRQERIKYYRVLRELIRSMVVRA